MAEPLPVHAGYEAWAATYDSDVNATRDLDAALLRATPLPLDGTRVVEFGAGTGKNTAYLASRARAVTALDFSEAMLGKARARVPAEHVRFLRHDVTRPWPVPDGEADLVVGNLVLEHIADLEAVFAAALRALTPSGLLVLSEFHPYRQWRGLGAKIGEQPIAVVVHTTAEFVNAGIAAGFSLRSMAEVGDGPDAGATGGPPRLLQLIFAAA